MKELNNKRKSFEVDVVDILKGNCCKRYKETNLHWKIISFGEENDFEKYFSINSNSNEGEEDDDE